MLKQKPLIGITLDSQDPEAKKENNSYSPELWYALRHRYVESIQNAGGVALCLPHSLENIEIYAYILDGILITGGGFDVDPRLYGESNIHPTVFLKPQRTAFELALCKEFIKIKKPILGICGGMQLMNVAYGGTLFQHLPDDMPSHIDHAKGKPAKEACHTIKIHSSSLLFKISNLLSTSVNSVHHQAVKDVAPSLLCSAISPEDHIIEGIEDPHHPFSLGIQWHPEFHINKLDSEIFKAFCKACSSHL